MEQFIIFCCVWFIVTGTITMSYLIVYGVSVFPCSPRDYKSISSALNKFGAVLLSILGFFVFWPAYICRAIKFICTVHASGIKG